MGLFITHPDGSKRYICIGNNKITILRLNDKRPNGSLPEGEVIRWGVIGQLTVWSVENGTPIDPQATSELKLAIPSLTGIDIPELIYEEYKKSLFNYEDVV
jgi:hypothetical protein